MNNAFRKEPDAGKPHVRFLGGAHLVKGASTRPGKNGELLEVDTRDKKDLFKAISGQLEMVGRVIGRSFFARQILALECYLIGLGGSVRLDRDISVDLAAGAPARM